MCFRCGAIFHLNRCQPYIPVQVYREARAEAISRHDVRNAIGLLDMLTRAKMRYL